MGSIIQLFRRDETKKAIIFSVAGGQALQHVPAAFSFVGEQRDWFRIPGLRVRLFDCNKKRLVKTLKDIGIHSVHIHAENFDNQHVFISGKPRERILRGLSDAG